MRDDKLWHEIKAAPSALATADLTVEWAICKSLHRTFQLSKDNCVILMLEYRRFRYLHDIADGPLLPSPLIAFIQARDTPNSTAFAERKRWWGGAVRPANSALSSFVHEPAYQRALDLYQQEFGATPPYQIWPTRLQAQRKNQAYLACGLGLVISIIGRWAQSGTAATLGYVLFIPAIAYLIFFDHHWAEPPGDA
ncbi:hypothetical protein [Cypionkella sp.]|uniref:hypothetical protein n=1 Tax=Cypionkella sp. TaxID=2811411 RepID=UPI002ABCA9FD|nr:hypothetical protein [Cypionkella sp.]MDZ4392147.1 hypothetical protein [Cypionkella sp.]